MPLPAVTEEERLRERVYATLQALADSAMAADEAARRAMDWTITDSQGRKWGVSPGAIHIAGITLPLPLMFTTPAGRRDEVNSLQRQWAEIQQQAELGLVRATVQERAAAIRERNDRERAAAAGTAAGTQSSPTTGSGRAASDGDTAGTP
jgi:multidrug efflux pump subunit AcrB